VGAGAGLLSARAVLVRIAPMKRETTSPVARMSLAGQHADIVGRHVPVPASCGERCALPCHGRGTIRAARQELCAH
jgi:hypothetical protein